MDNQGGYKLMRMSRRMGLLGGKKQPPAPPTLLPTLAELFADMTVKKQGGRNNSRLGTASMSVKISINPSIYVFAFCNDSFAIHHLLSNGSEYGKTTLYRATDDSNATDIYISGTRCYLSTSGSSSANVYGGTIIAATFPSYTDDQISAVFGNISVKNSAGRDSSTTGTIYLSNTAITGEIILTVYGGAMCAAPATSPTEYICIFNSSYYDIRNYVDSSKTYLSNNGTSSASVYGGTILTI